MWLHHLLELGVELRPQRRDEEHEAQLVKLNTGGGRPVDAGGYALNETIHKPDGGNRRFLFLEVGQEDHL